jgi:hypothetical protein
MLSVSNGFKTAINAPTRRLSAKVELYTGSTLNAAYTQNDALKSITIDRVGEESKFFGFIVSHKFNIKLRDVPRTINITTANNLKISIGVTLSTGSVEYVSFPLGYVTEVHRDENTNELSITAYDLFNISKTLYTSDLDITAPYTIKSFINACNGLLKASSVIIPNLDIFDLEYPDGANFEGTETIYEALTMAAEATQTICYLNNNNQLVFKRLDKSGAAAKTITKENYFTLTSSTNRRLQTIANTTQLGDNVSASTSQVGTTQYIRDNAFLELREDIATLIDNAVAEIGNITINQFECDWRSDPSVEVGDKIDLITKDNNKVTSYIINDTITYDGGLSEASSWDYEESEETDSNPTSLGEVLKQTFAKVDKANKQVDIVSSETSANSEAIGALQLNTESINASVKNVEANTAEAIDNLNTDIGTLTKQVEAKMTAEDVSIAIQSQLENGVDKVTTTTGFKFDESGLNISKTGSEMTTRINEDGMTIHRDNEEVLTANNEGVKAYNLHANTYLIIGQSSRFEDYQKDGETRTGCFWIGGGN